MNKSAPTLARRLRLSPRSVSLLIALFVFAGVIFLWQLGWLQFLEFNVYDFLIRHQPKAASSDPLVLVEMTEADISSPLLDYPIHDDKLAELLGNLAVAQPAAIGLDIWRNIPVPKNGAGQAQFNKVLQAHSNIVAIFTLGGIPPPAALGWNPDRVAYNDNLNGDVEVDHTVPKVRRTMLYGQRAGESQTYDAFPLRLALLYLQQRGIQLQPDPTDPNQDLLGKGRLRWLQPNDGAYVRADTGGRQLLIDFKCPNQFTRFSFSEILAGAVPAEKLRDKILIVGMKSDSVSDERITPLSRNQPGVEVQALIVNQLLRMALDGERSLRFWADWGEASWALLWSLLGGILGYGVRSPWRLALLAGVGVLALALTAWFSFMAGWWIPFVMPAMAFVPAAACVVSVVSHQERSMRNLLMKLYSRHVSKEIAASMWADRDSFLDGGRPRAQKLVVTVLFTDLKGFSTISEKMEAPRLYEWLNGYLGAMARVIQDHGGVLKQFTGDGILVLFGVPLPHTTKEEQANDARKGVQCALAMGRRLVELHREWQAEGLPAVSMRAGLYTGEVAAGSIGSDDRFEYAVIGDVVNTASRLESYDKSFADTDLLPNRCRVLVGASTHELLGDGFVTKEIGLLQVKGKINRVAVFQVFDEKVAGGG